MARRVGIARLVLVALGAATAVVLATALVGPSRAGWAAGHTTRTTHCGILGCATTTVPPVPSTTAPTVPKSTPSTTAPKTSRTTVPTSGTTLVAPLLTTPLPSTTTTSTTSTTIAAIGSHLPRAPQTLPLRTHGSNAHVDPVFAMLSGIGFFLAFVIIAGRIVITSPRRRRAST